MATTYGAPTNLDLSACSVTATGGSTSQTLADLSKAVGDNATAVATATQNAASANTTAQAAQTTANAASTAVSNLGTTYIPQTSIGVANGVVGTDGGNGAMIPVAADGGGYVTYNQGIGESWLWMSSMQYVNHGASSPNSVQGHHAGLHFGGAPRTINGNATPTAYLEVSADVFQPMHITTDLGQADTAWANIYSTTAVQVTSDATMKTVQGTLGDATYTAGENLLKAIYSIDLKSYKLNDAIALKENDARVHVGVLAQDVESALTSAGIDPSTIAMWTKTPCLTFKEVTGADGKVTTERTPELDSNGNQVYRQMVRYEELLCVYVAALKEKITALESDVAALKAKVGS